MLKARVLPSAHPIYCCPDRLCPCTSDFLEEWAVPGAASFSHPPCFNPFLSAFVSTVPQTLLVPGHLRSLLPGPAVSTLTSSHLQGAALIRGSSPSSFFFFLFVVNFVIHWNKTAMGLHVFPIPIPPPTSLSTRSPKVLPSFFLKL